jgi:hypothetical protein
LAHARYNRVAMIFQLFWLRESGCDAATNVSADVLPSAIRQRVLDLTTPECSVYQVRLPFLDRREERSLDEILGAVPLERVDSLIRAVLDPAAATRDMAATCALTDPLWLATPLERDAAYTTTWQRVSLALQRWLRDHIAEECLRNPAHLEDRAACFPILVYQACRPFFGKGRTEFTYDLRDFPWRMDTVMASMKLAGRGLQRVMEGIEQRLQAVGQDALARKYAPLWYEDVLVAVKRRPKLYADLLARESAIINAVIDLGTPVDARGNITGDRPAARVEAINRAAKVINQQLRRIPGPGGSLDLRGLGCGVLEEATRALEQQSAPRMQDVLVGWPLEHADMGSAGGPDAWLRA